MRFTVIRDLSLDPAHRVELAGESIPVPSIVEDETGVRTLFAPPDRWPGDLALVGQVAHEAHVVGIFDPATFEFVAMEPSAVPRTVHPEQTFVEMATPPPPRASGFVHLHLHTEFSSLDGLTTIPEVLGQVIAHGQSAVAVTDHGNCAAHAALAQAVKNREVVGDHEIHPIFGIEANLVDDRLYRPPSGDKDAQHAALWGYWHLTLWAKDQEGLHNLWRLSTEANRTGLYGRPRMDWDLLAQHSRGVACGTACLRGPVSRAITHEQDDVIARQRLGRLLDIYGEDLYAEVHTTQSPEQRNVNEELLGLCVETGVRPIAVVDSHYACPEDADTHRVWLAVATGDNVADDATLFTTDDPYHIMGEDEVRQALGYLNEDLVDIAVENTTALASQCTAELVPEGGAPIFTGSIESDEERLQRLCLERWDDLVVKPGLDEEVYFQRLAYELSVYQTKQFCGYDLMIWDICNRVRERGILIGPGRGSGGGSIVAWLLGITGIDPIEAGLYFERFLNPGRDALPDFDIDFPSSRAAEVHQIAIDRWGEDRVVRIGSHLRLRNRGVIRRGASALAPVLTPRLADPGELYRDVDAMADMIAAAEANTAGLGLKWDKLMDEIGDDLAPYVEKYPELFAWAEKAVGRLNTYGKHAAGFVISTSGSIDGAFPMRRPSSDDDTMVTEWDFEVFEWLRWPKNDFLMLRNLDTIQGAMDLIRDRHGVTLDPWSWTSSGPEYGDPKVWDAICAGETKGMFQIETPAATRMCREMRPRSISDLSDLVALNRPGPKRSGLYDIFLRRRDGEEAVTYDHPALEQVLGRTNGVIVYQEDVMAVAQALAGYTLAEADVMRKILGKKKVDDMEAEGVKFLAGCAEHGVDPQVAHRLWTQIREFSKYCVVGDTEVHLAAGNQRGDRVTVEELYRRLHTDHGPARTRHSPPFEGPCVVCGNFSTKYVRSACNACRVWRDKFLHPERGLYGLTVHVDERIRPCRILDVIDQGEDDVWTVTLVDGRSITATANHCHLTPEGFRRVDDLTTDDCLVVDLGYEPDTYRPERDRVTVGERSGDGSVLGQFGERNFGYIDGGFARLSAWTANAPDHCEFCGHDGSEHRLERAHLDGDRKNNDPTNLAMLCVRCHKRHDYEHNGRRRRWEKGHVSGGVKIASIVAAGRQRTYSVVMDDPHIWIANGIATSNSFNRAHSWGYALVAAWCAWLKVNYPAEFMAAILASVKKERLPEMVREAKRLGYAVKPPDINESAVSFVGTDDSVRYGLASLGGIGDKVAASIIENRPYTSFDDFVERSGVPSNVTTLLIEVGAFDSLAPNRRALMERWAWDLSEDSATCQHKDLGVSGPNGLPCTFDWDSEPPPVSPKTGKALKRKPPVKKCTRGCRNYRPPVRPEMDGVKNFTPVEIRGIERERLKIGLTADPLDAVPKDVLKATDGAVAVEGADVGDERVVVGVVESLTRKVDKRGGNMAFLTLRTKDGDLRVACFSDLWEEVGAEVAVDQLVAVEVKAGERGPLAKGLAVV